MTNYLPYQFILLAPFLAVAVAAFFIKSKPYFLPSILLSLGLSSWAVIFYFIRLNGPHYGGADIGAGIVIGYSWYVTIPLVFIGLLLGKLITLKKSIIFTVLLLCVWIGLSLSYILSIKLKAKESEQQAIIHCETMPYHCAIDENRLSDLSLLKYQGYDIESKDGKGYTALIRYLYNPQAVKVLLELGANPSSTGRDNRKAITLALVDQKPYIETAELLVEYGADINKGYFEQGSEKHMTLLGYAISIKNTSLVIFLIKHGADPTIKDGYGYTACDRARIYQLKTIDQLNNICQPIN